MLNREQLAQKYQISLQALAVLEDALRRGGGKVAQFSHPELGGMGQWMPGMTIVSDFSKQATVAGLCQELALHVGSAPSAASDSTHLGLSGSCGDLHYSYSRAKNILEVTVAGRVQRYRTDGHEITSASASSFGSQFKLHLSGPQGEIDWNSLPLIEEV